MNKEKASTTVTCPNPNAIVNGNNGKDEDEEPDEEEEPYEEDPSEEDPIEEEVDPIEEDPREELSEEEVIREKKEEEQLAQLDFAEEEKEEEEEEEPLEEDEEPSHLVLTEKEEEEGPTEDDEEPFETEEEEEEEEEEEPYMEDGEELFEEESIRKEHNEGEEQNEESMDDATSKESSEKPIERRERDKGCIYPISGKSRSPDLVPDNLPKRQKLTSICSRDNSLLCKSSEKVSKEQFEHTCPKRPSGWDKKLERVLSSHPTASALGSEDRIMENSIDEGRLYVGYLPPSMNDEKLIALFSPFGKICHASIPREKNTGLSKGIGFVKYTDAADAAKARLQMNGYMIGGHTLAVWVAGLLPSKAHLTGDKQLPSTCRVDAELNPLTGGDLQVDALHCDKADETCTVSGNANLETTLYGHQTILCSSNGKPIDYKNIYVGNLPLSVDEAKLIELFSPFGEIQRSRLLRDRNTGFSRGSGFIRYTDAASAAKAISRMNGSVISGIMLVVSIASTRLSPGANMTGMRSSSTGTSTYAYQASPTSELGGGQPLSRPPYNTSVTYATYMPWMVNPWSTSIPWTADPGSSALPYGSLPNKVINEANLYVCHLPLHVDESKLMEMFSPFGTISQLKIPRDVTTGWSRGFGFVRYTDAGNAANAIACMNGCILDGHVLGVRVAGVRPSMTSTYTFGSSCYEPVQDPSASSSCYKPVYEDHSAVMPPSIPSLGSPGPPGFGVPLYVTMQHHAYACSSSCSLPHASQSSGGGSEVIERHRAESG